LDALQSILGDRLQTEVPLARYTSARVGGPADYLAEVRSANELAQYVSRMWELDVPFVILGGGSNVLVSDAGVRGVVLLNHARRVRFDLEAEPPEVWAESGANFGAVARQAASRGLSGLEWAAGIPGTVGGALVGNAGAHGGDMAGNVLLAEILHHEETMQEEVIHRERWSVEKMQYTYRSSIMKRQPGQIVALSAWMRLERSTHQSVQTKMEEYLRFRRRTQPPGASMGSMFKNPPGDYAGRLIEAAGLKGKQLGAAQISSLHANFFVNQGQASAAQIYNLIETAQQAVAEKFGVALELEIELVGEWN